MPVIPELRSWRQKNREFKEFEVNLGSIMPYFKIHKQSKPRKTMYAMGGRVIFIFRHSLELVHRFVLLTPEVGEDISCHSLWANKASNREWKKNGQNSGGSLGNQLWAV